MNLKPAFSRFLGSDPERLHFAAHSHHPWPDVTLEAHTQAWMDAATMMDDKWGHIFGDMMDGTRSLIASNLGLADPQTIVFAPNTHELVNRVFSCFEPPVRVLTTDAEFHSFTRQSKRWAEEGLALLDVVSAKPFDTFAERFTAQARSGAHDLIYLSAVFFDSGFVVPNIDRIVSSVSEENAFVVVDGYHAFMARPTDLGAIQDRAFFIAGGYKYAMAGEGVCFMHCPPGYGPRPVNTGWYAGFGQLESGVSDRIPYGEDGSRFFGATFDPSGIYRMRAVLAWLQEEGVTVADVSRHVQDLQTHFLEAGPGLGELAPPIGHNRGNFLTFEGPKAEGLYNQLHAHKVITDYRGDRLRLGFGVYQDHADVDRLLRIVEAVTAS